MFSLSIRCTRLARPLMLFRVVAWAVLVVLSLMLSRHPARALTLANGIFLTPMPRLRQDTSFTELQCRSLSGTRKFSASSNVAASPPPLEAHSILSPCINSIGLPLPAQVSAVPRTLRTMTWPLIGRRLSMYNIGSLLRVPISLNKISSAPRELVCFPPWSESIRTGLLKTLGTCPTLPNATLGRRLRTRSTPLFPTQTLPLCVFSFRKVLVASFSIKTLWSPCLLWPYLLTLRVQSGLTEHPILVSFRLPVFSPGESVSRVREANILWHPSLVLVRRLKQRPRRLPSRRLARSSVVPVVVPAGLPPKKWPMLVSMARNRSLTPLTIPLTTFWVPVPTPVLVVRRCMKPSKLLVALNMALTVLVATLLSVRP